MADAVTTVLTPEARAVLQTAFEALCHATGLPAGQGRLIRYAMNAVWALDEQSIVVRMAPGASAARAAVEHVRVAKVLMRAGAPVVPLAELVQPVTVDGWTATYWRLLPHDVNGADPNLMVSPLRALHGVDVPQEFLPAWDVVGKVERRLRAATMVAGRPRSWLEQWAPVSAGMPLGQILGALGERLSYVRSELPGAPWQLPWGVVHGDAHTGNLLQGERGVVWCDLDSVAFGPLEWDLVPAAFGPLRFGRDHRLYKRFTLQYGYDVTMSPAWPVLRELRDLQAISSVLAELPGRPVLAAEVGRRVRSVLRGEAITWQRFK